MEKNETRFTFRENMTWVYLSFYDCSPPRKVHAFVKHILLSSVIFIEMSEFSEW